MVDLTGVTFMDCSCVGVLAAGARRAGPARLRVVGVAGRVRKVLDITGAAATVGIDPAGTGTPGHQRDAAVLETVEAVLAARAVLPDRDPRREALRTGAVERCVPLAARLAGHYRPAGQAGDDLVQVALIGMINAIDRYDPARGGRFISFALPTVFGELRRHFRDHTWGVHVPRQLQELRLSIDQAADALTQRLRHTPSTTELAEHLAVTREEVNEAMLAAAGYAPASLSRPLSAASPTQLADLIGEPDRELERVEQREAIMQMVARLPDQERQVLTHRFSGNLPQAQIARLLGVSQMQVSRLQRRALARLRVRLLAC